MGPIIIEVSPLNVVSTQIDAVRVSTRTYVKLFGLDKGRDIVDIAYQIEN
jgi:hypothetical protein